MSVDTRHKIIAPGMLSALPPDLVRDSVAFVTHMEVLQASHIRKLDELAAANPGKLFVVLTDPESPWVPMEARAEMAAALGMVDYVVPSPDGSGPVLAAMAPALIVDDEEEDRERTRLLLEHVRRRARS